MMAYLARVMNGHLEVYPLQGYVMPKAWTFLSYERGAAAVNNDRDQAIVQARAEYAGKWSALARRRFIASVDRKLEAARMR